MIKGKHKNLTPEENLNSIMAANAGLVAWRVKARRPRRRVTIAYGWQNGDGTETWAEFEWRQRYYMDAQKRLKLGVEVTYHRQSERPRGGFIADGKPHLIEKPSGELDKVSCAFTLGKKIGVPGDIVLAFQKVWGINVDKNLINNAYDNWKTKNE